MLFRLESFLPYTVNYNHLFSEPNPKLHALSFAFFSFLFFCFSKILHILLWNQLIHPCRTEQPNRSLNVNVAKSAAAKHAWLPMWCGWMANRSGVCKSLQIPLGSPPVSSLGGVHLNLLAVPIPVHWGNEMLLLLSPGQGFLDFEKWEDLVRDCVRHPAHDGRL